MSLWALDKHTKNFIRVAWRRRTAKVGSFSTHLSEGGRLALTHIPPPAGCEVLADPPNRPPLRRVTDPRFKEFWAPWLHMCRAPSARQHSPSRRKNFFIVWRGRKKGIFYKWSHCLASIRGYKGAKFKGFDSLQEACDRFTELMSEDSQSPPL